jgi:hypothetical protein
LPCWINPRVCSWIIPLKCRVDKVKIKIVIQLVLSSVLWFLIIPLIPNHKLHPKNDRMQVSRNKTVLTSPTWWVYVPSSSHNFPRHIPFETPISINPAIHPSSSWPNPHSLHLSQYFHDSQAS